MIPDLKNVDVIIASVQSLGRKNASDRLKKYHPQDFKCIIIDEAHHSVASTYKTILDHFHVLHPDSHILLWGCSATMMRLDQKSLGYIFENVTFTLTFDDMVNRKWLCQPRMIHLYSKIISDDQGEKYKDTTLSINTPTRNKILLDAWAKLARQPGDEYCRSTVIFATNIEHVQALVNVFREEGIPTDGITSETLLIQRAKILDRFKRGELHVLVNCSIITEGTDLPMVDCIVLARPTKSASLFVQMVGRGVRLFPGKKNCLVIYAAFREGSLYPVSMHVVPTLEGLAFTEQQKIQTHQESSKKIVNDIAREKILLTIEERISDPIHSLFDYTNLTFHHLDWIMISPTLYIVHGLILVIHRNQTSRSDDSNGHVLASLYKWNMDNKHSSTEIIENTLLSHALDIAFQYCVKEKTISLNKRQAYWKRQSITGNDMIHSIKCIPSLRNINIYKWTCGMAFRVLTKYYFLKDYLKRDAENSINKDDLLRGTIQR